MAERPSDIIIGIDVQLVGESKDTIEALSNLNKVLSRLAKVTVVAKDGMVDLGRGAIDVSGAIKTVRDMAEEFRKAMKMSDEDRKAFLQDIADIAAAAEILKTRTQGLNIVAQEWTRNLQDFILAPTPEKIEDMAIQIQEFSRAGMKASEIVKVFATAFRGIGKAIPSILWQQLGPYLIEKPKEALPKILAIGEAFQLVGSKARMMHVWETKGIDGLVEFAQTQALVNRRNREIADSQRMVTASLGKGMMAVRDLSRSFFWAGLGAMFAAMSYARYKNRILAMQSAELSYIRSLNNAKEAERALMDLTDKGIISGREYADAALSLKEANLQVAYSEERVTQMGIQKNLAWIMFVTGTVPTAIRALNDLWSGTLKLIGALSEETLATILAAIAKGQYRTALLTTIPVMAGVEIAAWKLFAAFSALALGLPLIAGLFSQIAAQEKARKSMERMKKEISGLHSEMTQPGSPSFLESLEEVSTQFREFRKLPKMGKGLGFESTSIGPTSITITGPVSIRSEDDIRKLAYELRKQQIASMRRKGGYII